LITFFSSFWGLALCIFNLDHDFLRTEIMKHHTAAGKSLSRVCGIVLLAWTGLALPTTNLYSIAMERQTSVPGETADTNNQALTNIVITAPALWVCVCLAWTKAPVGYIFVPAMTIMLGLGELQTLMHTGWHLLYSSAWTEDILLDLIPGAVKGCMLLISGLFMVLSLP
jgi:hypothetical protein